jgi:mannan endo-1,4-beta-mannosidase
MHTLNRILLLTVSIVTFVCATPLLAQSFVQRAGTGFRREGKPYYFTGTNYWYGGLLGLEKEVRLGKDRLRKELDFLAAAGISNLRVMVGAEGSGLINGVQRVSPPFQPQKGVFEVKNLEGLDLLLSEMGNRKMTAVLFFSNNWEWSGGFLQYLNWNGRIADSTVQRKLSWDETRDNVAAFYTCKPCMDDYKKGVRLVLGRTNSLTGKRYTEDPTIMSWELANEPRPMRPASNAAYKRWISDVAALIKSRDKNHLVTIGHEGEMGTESITLYE